MKIRRSTRRGDLFIILYSIVDRSSFDEAQSIARYIKDHRSNVESMSIVIVATKKDLDHLRRVDIEEGIALSNEVECTFYEVSISEGYNEVHDLLKELLKRVLNHRNIDKRDTLKIPSLGLRRAPSIEKRKRTQSYPDKNDALISGSSPETQRKEYVESPLKSKSVRDLNEENGSKHKFMSRSSPITQRKKNPFFVEKVKGVAAEKIEENKTNGQVKSGNPAGHRDRACGLDSTDANNNENKKATTDRNTEKPKGPFSLNKAQDRPTTFGRMRFGLERTFGRKKYVYNL